MAKHPNYNRPPLAFLVFLALLTLSAGCGENAALQQESNRNDAPHRESNRNDAPHRELNRNDGTVKVYEIDRYFSRYRYGPTLKMYHFQDNNAVLKIRITGSRPKNFNIEGALHLFEEKETLETIAYWINNQHSDAIYGDAARPTQTIAIYESGLKIVSQEFREHEIPRLGDEYDNYRVQFSVDEIIGQDNVHLHSFSDNAVAHIRILSDEQETP